MSRLANALLGQNAFGRMSQAAMVDPTTGGYEGYYNQLGVPGSIVSNSAYVRQHVIPVLLEAPRFFTLMPEPQKWVEALKAMMEKHCRTIEGLTSEIELEWDEHPAGGAGEMHQEIVNSKRARSEPVTGHVELAGRPFQMLLKAWLQFGCMDPDTKTALVGSVTNQPLSDTLLDWNTMSMAFIEPDRTHKRVMKSWICTNMMPKKSGDEIGKRDITENLEQLTMSIPWSAITQTNQGTNAFCQQILDQMNLLKANPYFAPSQISSISADVAAADTGYKNTAETLGRTAVGSAAAN